MGAWGEGEGEREEPFPPPKVCEARGDSVLPPNTTEEEAEVEGAFQGESVPHGERDSVGEMERVDEGDN